LIVEQAFQTKSDDSAFPRAMYLAGICMVDDGSAIC